MLLLARVTKMFILISKPLEGHAQISSSPPGVLHHNYTLAFPAASSSSRLARVPGSEMALSRPWAGLISDARVESGGPAATGAAGAVGSRCSPSLLTSTSSSGSSVRGRMDGGGSCTASPSPPTLPPRLCIQRRQGAHKTGTTHRPTLSALVTQACTATLPLLMPPPPGSLT